MGNRNRHTVTLEDDVWKWANQMDDKTDMNASEVINRAVKVYAGKLASGEWNDPRLSDKYDQRLQELVNHKG